MIFCRLIKSDENKINPKNKIKSFITINLSQIINRKILNKFENLENIDKEQFANFILCKTTYGYY